MPTKRAVLAELTRAELRDNLDHYELAVDDRRRLGANSSTPLPVPGKRVSTRCCSGSLAIA